MERRRDYVRSMRTALLVASWFCMGIRMGVHASTIPDQRERLGVSTDMLTYAFAIGNVGSLAGPLLSAFSDRFHKHGDLVYSILISLYGIIFGLKPVCTQLWTYAVLEILESMCMSVASPVANGLMLAMWGRNAQPAMQVFGIGWSVGGIFGPLIAVPFVSMDDHQAASNMTCNGTATTQSSFVNIRYFPEVHDTTSSRSDRYPDNSRIEIAFWIVMLCYLFVASLFIVMYIVFKPQAIGKRKKYSWKEILYPAKWAGGDAALGVKVLLLFIIMFMVFTGTYYGPSTLIATYASDSNLGFDNQEAAMLSSAYSLSGTVGRVVCIFLAKCVDVTPLLGVLTHGMLTGALLMLFVGTQSKTGLWVTVCVFSVFYRPQWGCYYTWANNYIILLAALIGVQGLINSIYSIFITSLQGYLYERNIDTVFYTTSVYAALVCIVYYFMVGVGYQRATRHVMEDKREDQRATRHEMEAKREDQKQPSVFIVAVSDEKTTPIENESVCDVNGVPTFCESTQL